MRFHLSVPTDSVTMTPSLESSMQGTTRLRFVLTVLVLVVLACTDSIAPGRAVPRAALALANSRTADTVPNSYIVMFTRNAASTRDRTRALATTLLQRYGGRVGHIYDVLGGFSVDSLPPNAVGPLSKEPGVAYVEANLITYPSYVTQLNPGNGLDRLDQAYRPLDQSFSYAFDGTGVHVYILDTGVDTTSGEWAGRVGNGVSCVPFGLPPYSSNDNEGHGTSVASVAIGTTYGVAKRAILHSVRISYAPNGTASTSDVNCGINWVASYATKPAVANWSFGGYPDAFSTRDAINNVTLTGNMSFVKAAGNEARDAWEDRGNRATLEWVVGALDPTNDTFAYFPGVWGSDYGTTASPTVNMIAPGVNVLVADKFNPSIPKLANGTSIAAPFVAGVIAQYLQSNPTAGTQTVFDAINNAMTTYGSVNGLTGVFAQTPNKELHSVLWCIPTC